MPARNAHYASNREPLLPSPFVQLPLGSIKAAGWLAEQLRLQIEGLTGHLDRLFDDVGPGSAWLGGDGEDWERGPYYVRGATALAYATGDAGMIAKVGPWIEWSINSQREDGYFGPSRRTTKTHQGEGFNDWWPRMIMLQVMQMHHEATGDPRVIPFMARFFAYQRNELPARPLKSWSYRRGGDNSDSVYWLYNRTGDKALLELADLLIGQTYDWTGDFLKDQAINSHVVNLAQGYKQPGIRYQQSKDACHREAVFKGLENAFKYHGRIDGMHSGDEAEAGRSSVRGTELCAVTEFMHSLETLLKILGEPALADRLERVAFNALPAMIAPDWKGHQYFSQPNQVLCTREPHGFETDHGDDLTFGVLAGYPCCATNMHMGWPMLAHHLWLATADDGLAAVVYGPCEVTAKVAGGGEVTIIEETDYPFKEQISFTILPRGEVWFPLVLRIPGWCDKATIRINGKTGPAAAAGSFVRLDRQWKTGDRVTLDLPMTIRASTWENNSVGIERGPLAFVLAIEEEWRRYPDWRRGSAKDDFPCWEVHPKSAWNYGLILDRDNPGAWLTVDESPVPAQPWCPEVAPVSISAQARRIPGWGMGAKANAAAVPTSPVASTEPAERVRLLPFGAARLRISYIPVLAR